VKNGAVEIRAFLVRVEKWETKFSPSGLILIIKKKEKRPLLIKFFKVYLMAAIWIISPIVLVLHLLTTPIFWFKRKNKENIYKELI
jgi:hypothetical protein